LTELCCQKVKHTCIAEAKNPENIQSSSSWSWLLVLTLYCITPHNPHRGLPPCRGGGAYAPMTLTICNLKERN